MHCCWIDRDQTGGSCEEHNLLDERLKVPGGGIQSIQSIRTGHCPPPPLSLPLPLSPSPSLPLSLSLSLPPSPSLSLSPSLCLSLSLSPPPTRPLSHPQNSLQEWIIEENFKFKLSAFQDRLLEFYEANPNWITPAFRQREVEAFVKKDLLDLSVSRKQKICKWAIPVPAETKHKTEEQHCVYVWLDALTNYVTAAEQRQRDPAHSDKVHLYPPTQPSHFSPRAQPSH